MFNLKLAIDRLLSSIGMAAAVWLLVLVQSGPAEPIEPSSSSIGPLGAASMTDTSGASNPVDARPTPAGPGVVAGPFMLGDNLVLDELWASCESGDGNACNELFEQSPVGSDYERFGVSCGNRPGVLDCN